MLKSGITKTSSSVEKGPEASMKKRDFLEITEVDLDTSTVMEKPLPKPHRMRSNATF